MGTLAEHVYEGLFIFDSGKYQRDPAGVVAKVTGLVERFQGTILASRLWEDRRLAYPIKGQRRGAYWLLYFKLSAGEVTHLNRELQIEDNLLRHLVLKIDARIADAMVQHAIDGTSAAPATPAPVSAPKVLAVAAAE
jgi:small subunit ribosomal protein S6